MDYSNGVCEDHSCSTKLSTTTNNRRLRRRRSGRGNYKSGKQVQKVVGRRQQRRGGVGLKVRKLQKLIPGGQGLEPDMLFLKTADYILQLKYQLHFLQSLAHLHNTTTTNQQST